MSQSKVMKRGKTVPSTLSTTQFQCTSTHVYMGTVRKWGDFRRLKATHGSHSTNLLNTHMHWENIIITWWRMVIKSGMMALQNISNFTAALLTVGMAHPTPQFVPMLEVVIPFLSFLLDLCIVTLLFKMKSAKSLVSKRCDPITSRIFYFIFTNVCLNGPNHILNLRNIG